MPKLTLAGHPLHPQLILFPAGLLPFSFVLDLFRLGTGHADVGRAAHYTLVGGSVGAMAAAAAGLPDYLAIQPGTPAKRTANLHAALNAGLLAMNGVNLMLRRGRGGSPGALPVLLSAMGTVGLLVSAWYGGHLVYTHGLRVRGVDPTAGTPEVRPPTDERVRAALEGALTAVPEQGPQADGAGASQPATVNPT
jgi:uncharacterized membrane protein